MRFSRAFVAAVLLVCASAEPVLGQAAPGAYVQGEVLVKFRPGVSAGAREEAHRQARGQLLAESARARLQRVAVARGDEMAAIARYRRNPNVLYAEPNHVRRIPAPLTHAPGSEVVPGDFHFDEQWALHNTGQLFYCFAWIDGEELCFYAGTPDADIDAPEAWASVSGSNVRVAVIDSGVDYTHPDIAPNYAGGNDFTSADGNPMDDHGHGTHVAGTIAAAMNNPTGDPAAEEGVVGVAPQAQILAYKVCTADGTCSDFAIVQAIGQAVADGARVINMSLGDTVFSQSLYDAVQDAWNANVVIVAGAGNNGTTEHFYPAAFDNVIAVGAFDEDHRRASFSNYGSWVDIAAPGNVIFSAYPLAACGGLSPEPGDTGCYTWNSGTSMATPHVAGAAALIWSRGDVVGNSQVVETLLDSADPKGVDAVRLDSWTAHGGLNIHDAASYGVANVAPIADAGPDQTLTDEDGDGVARVTLDATGSSDPDGTIVGYQWREGTTVLGVNATEPVFLPAGVHTITLEVADDDGATSSDTTSVTVLRPNAAPAAVNVAASTATGTPVSVTLAATDDQSCELAFSIVQGPASGSLGPISGQSCTSGTPNRDTAQVTYTPGTTPGTYTFTYRANDGAEDSASATATITVESPEPPPPAALTVTGITPSVVSQNAGVVSLIVTGTGFTDGAGVTFVNGSGATPRVLTVTLSSSTELRVNAEIRSGGPKKDRHWDVRVTNPDGTSATGARLLTVRP